MNIRYFNETYALTMGTDFGSSNRAEVGVYLCSLLTDAKTEVLKADGSLKSPKPER